MSTHCAIAVKQETGFNTIYCRHDGYPEYMWPMLTENYNSEEAATKLVSLGDASAIYKNLEPSGRHSFEQPEKDVCVFYHRDRGESWEDTAPEMHSIQHIQGYFYYSYIWFDGAWHFYKDGKEIIR